jgi:hypothetical protein
MKKIIYLVILLLSINYSCQDKLEDEYKDPNAIDPPKNKLVSGMWTAMTYRWKLYIRDYGEYWWQNDGWGISAYAQVNIRYITQRYAAYYADYADLETGVNGFQANAVTNNFNDYYNRMREWALIRDEVGNLSGQDMKDAQIYFELATVYKDFWALRNVDMFNKIPYFNAFKGNQGVFFVEYDDPIEIYKAVLNDWKRIAEALPEIYNNMSTIAKTTFKDQDIALGADVKKWVQYIQAIRLQYAVKLAGIDAITAKLHIQEALADLPTSDLTFPTYTSDTPEGGGTVVRGMYERTYVSFIPTIIMKRMNFGDSTYNAGTDDPRLPVLAMPTKYNDYRGCSMDADGQTAAYNAGDKYYSYGDNLNASLTTNAKSMYNFATFFWNYTKYPAMMMTVAEIDLLKAEVALKNLGITGKTAGEHIKDAVINSCNFWYGINASNKDWNAEVTALHPVKSDADISTYSDIVKTKFEAQTTLEDKMEILMQQKYIHINISNQYELWAELRRTRHPLLEPMTMNGVVMKPCPERLKYPSSELQNNQDNYLKVKDEDNFTNPIFWVPTDKRGVVYYRDGYTY